jgi:hypothetical protein
LGAAAGARIGFQTPYHKALSLVLKQDTYSMKHAILIVVSLLFCTQTRAQEIVYPQDSLSTQPTIPTDAVKIPEGGASGPSARLSHAIYNNIRFPRRAMNNGVGGKVIVYGIVDASGVFTIDSAGLFREQAVVVINEGQSRVESQDVPLGFVKAFVLKKKKWRIADAPRKWSLSEKDIVLEAVRVTKNLPPFNPGTKDGKEVAAYLEIPVVFRHGLDRF